MTKIVSQTNDMSRFFLWLLSTQTFFNPSHSLEKGVHPPPFQRDIFEILKCFVGFWLIFFFCILNFITNILNSKRPPISAIKHVEATRLEVHANLCQEIMGEIDHFFKRNYGWNWPLLPKRVSVILKLHQWALTIDNWRRIEMSFFIFAEIIRNQFLVFKISMFLWIVRYRKSCRTSTKVLNQYGTSSLLQVVRIYWK